jgi:hypothetical protein
MTLSELTKDVIADRSNPVGRFEVAEQNNLIRMG